MMKKKLFGAALVIIIVAGGVYYYQRGDYQRTDNTSEPAPAAEHNTPQVKTYTMEEVAKHGSDPDNYVDCWTVIHGKVYDITEFVDSMKHPGGEQIYRACGTDATELFENRPGVGTPHSAEARKMLEKYYIGDLKN